MTIVISFHKRSNVQGGAIQALRPNAFAFGSTYRPAARAASTLNAATAQATFIVASRLLPVLPRIVLCDGVRPLVGGEPVEVKIPYRHVSIQRWQTAVARSCRIRLRCSRGMHATMVAADLPERKTTENMSSIKRQHAGPTGWRRPRLSRRGI